MSTNVYLVGGGPGDLELLTRKAYRLIKEADCLIYDRLIDNRILQCVKVNCECIYVGKANRHHTMKQDDINELLVKKAKQHKCVVRLKGGDVYVFGRGGEEGMYLRKNHIPFEVVPGISSSIAGLAYAGIPITHRGIATGFHVVTAHNKQDELADIDFKVMAVSDDTCVFLMGLSKLKEISEQLLLAGKDKDSHVAIISNATLPTQDVVVSTLEHIVDAIENHPVSSPALIVVGEVVKLREHLNFFEEKPLFHKRILLPRVGYEPSELGIKLERLGAEVKEIQVSELKENTTALDSCDYALYTHIVLTSAHSIDYFMHSLWRNNVDIRSLAHIRFAVIGTSSEKQLWKYGIKAKLVPESYDSEALSALLKQDITKDSKILIPIADGNQYKWKPLQACCQVDIISLYTNQAICNDAVEEALMQSWDMAVFTCSSAVINTLHQKEIHADNIISIGKMTSATLAKCHIKNYRQSKQATYDSLIELILTI